MGRAASETHHDGAPGAMGFATLYPSYEFRFGPNKNAPKGVFIYRIITLERVVATDHDDYPDPPGWPPQ
jgi:hypothetical protein